MIKKLFLAFIALFISSSISGAATLYVSPDGSGEACSSESPCTIYYCNQNLNAGDTCVLKGGTYYIGTSSATGNGSDTDHLSPGLIPVATGTSGNVIEYKVNGTDVVNLVGVGGGALTRGIWINEKSYIKINGVSLGQLNITNILWGLTIGPSTGATASTVSTYNEICYVHIYDQYSSLADSYQQASAVWQGYFNHIHHNKFGEYGIMGKTDGSCDGDVFWLGIIDTGTPTGIEIKKTYYNVVENNEFYSGGHTTFQWSGSYNVIRNNYFHNEGWYEIDGIKYGYRDVIGNGRTGYVGYSLFEGNRMGHAAPNYTWDSKNGNWGGTGMKLCHPYNILRYNSFFNNSESALSLATYGTEEYYSDADHNHIYNNTFYKNGWYQKLPTLDYLHVDPISFGYIGNGNWTVMYGSVLKNNLFYDNANTYYTSGIYSRVWTPGNGQTADLLKVFDPSYGNVTAENNFNYDTNQNTDPLFVDKSVSNITSWTLPNLNLQSGSPAKDVGAHLTQASNAGSNSTNLIVNDARYFQDGNFGTGTTLDWPASVTIAADWICVGTVSNCSQINSIDYDINEITLSSALTWDDDAPVWLYKKSDGVQVLYGSAPDMGAHERSKQKFRGNVMIGGSADYD